MFVPFCNDFDTIQLMKRFLPSLTLFSLLLLAFSLLVIIMQFPSLSEGWVRLVHGVYQRTFGLLIDLIPFSMTELLWLVFYGFIGWSFITVIRFIQSKRWQMMLHRLFNTVNVTLSLIVLYVATAGVAYARLPVVIPQFEGTVPYTQYETIITSFQDDFHYVASQLAFDDKGSVINPHTWDTLNTLIRTEFESLPSSYYTSYTTRIKPMLFSWLYSEFHITGIHFAPSTEALVNAHIPDALIPFTMAHELAHAKGVMREEDANLVAMYITLSSEDPYLRYSGYFNTFYALLNMARYMGDDKAYGRLYNRFVPEIKNDFRYQGQFWSNYTLLNDMATFINDVYLRIMGNDGVSSYVDVPTIGTVVEGEETIQVIEAFSPYQKLYLYWYETLYD